MGPTQFMTQCVTNWKGLIKQPHISQIGDVEASPELRGQAPRQGLQQPGPIFRPGRSALFEFDDMPADLPAGLYLNGIDSP